MRIGIVGSRHFTELERVEAYVVGLSAPASLVTGSASGVDALVARIGRERGLPVRVVAAGFEDVGDERLAAERNQRLIDACDLLVAFWDGSSKGTRMTIDRALDMGREVHVFVPAREAAAR